MHKTLTNAVQFGASGVMTGTMQGKQRIHATVPIAHAAAAVAAVFILYIKAPAGRARVRTGAAINTGKRNFFPEACIVEVVGLDSPKVVGLYESRYGHGHLRLVV